MTSATAQPAGQNTDNHQENLNRRESEIGFYCNRDSKGEEKPHFQQSTFQMSALELQIKFPMKIKVFLQLKRYFTITVMS